ncbi:MAG: RidA family protein [Pseudomonadota bacterium]
MSAREADANSVAERPEADAPTSGLGKPPRYRRAGSFVFVSGTAAKASAGADIRAQTKACIEDISAVLEEVGGGLENLVEVTSYLKQMADFVDYNQTYSTYFSVNGPARTTVAVDRLSDPNALIEMRGVAYIAQNTNA